MFKDIHLSSNSFFNNTFFFASFSFFVLFKIYFFAGLEKFCCTALFFLKKLCWQHRVCWFFIAIHHSFCILHLYRADVSLCWLLKHAHPCAPVYKKTLLMSSSLLLHSTLCLVHLTWFMRWEVVGHINDILWGAVSRICSKQHAAFLWSSYLPFS